MGSMHVQLAFHRKKMNLNLLASKQAFCWMVVVVTKRDMKVIDTGTSPKVVEGRKLIQEFIPGNS